MSEKKKRWLNKWRLLWSIGAVVVCMVLWNVFTGFYPLEEKSLRRQIRENVKEKFPKQTAQFSQTLGLFPFDPSRKTTKDPLAHRKTVVLIHGLDDPAMVWMNLAPELDKENFDVWLMHYPNDQAITESSRFFYDELKKLRQFGIQHISIVAHSMGGLVSREMLTRPEIEYSLSVNNGLLPAVETLIMVGTPHHGSQLARFRLFGELRDHIARMRNGEGNWLGFILDGAGEAKVDLLPGSHFLTELNARPHPADVNMLIIAGMSSPWDENAIQGGLDGVVQRFSADRQEEINALARYLIAMTHGLGDGLVTVQSSRLPGGSHRTVTGTHLSMIRNITLESQRIPPAIPIIIDTLKGIDLKKNKVVH